MKSLVLVERAIENSSKPGELNAGLGPSLPENGNPVLMTLPLIARLEAFRGLIATKLSFELTL